MIKEEKTTSQSVAFEIDLNSPKSITEKEDLVKKRLEQSS